MIFRRRRRNGPVLFAYHPGGASIPSDWATLLWGFTPDMSGAKGAWAIPGVYPTFRGPSRASSPPELAVTSYAYENTLSRNRAITLNQLPLNLPQSVSFDGRTFLSGKRMQSQAFTSGGTDAWTVPVDLTSSYAPNTNNQYMIVAYESAIWDNLMNTASYASYYAWNGGLQGAIQIVDNSNLYIANVGLMSVSGMTMWAHFTSGISKVSEDTTADFYQLLNSSVGVSPRGAAYTRQVYIVVYRSSAAPTVEGYLYVKGASTPAGGYVMGGTRIGYDNTARTWNKAAYPSPYIRFCAGLNEDLRGGVNFGAVGIWVSSSAPSASVRDSIATAMLNNANF